MGSPTPVRTEVVSFDARRNASASAPLEGMARYFFHSDNGVAHRDADGVEFPTDDAAGLEAVRLLGELLAERPEAFWSSEALIITVTRPGEEMAFALRASVVRGAGA